MKSKISLAVFGVIIIAVIALFVITKSNISNAGSLKYFESAEEIQQFLSQNVDSSYQAFADRISIAQEAGDGAAPLQEKTGSYSQTNVQVAGVDEPDIVKTDGVYIYVVSGSNISVIKANPSSSPRLLSVINVNGYVQEIFIRNNVLVIFGQESSGYVPYYGCPECDVSIATSKLSAGAEMAIEPYPYYSPKSFIKLYDLSDYESPQEKESVVYDGSYYNARMIDNYVYVVAQQPIFQQEESVQLPSVKYGNVEEKIAPEDIAYSLLPDAGYQLTTIFALNLDTDELERSTFMTGYTQTLYVSEHNIYIAAPLYISYENYREKFIEEVVIALLDSSTEQYVTDELESKQPFYQKDNNIREYVAGYYNRLSQSQKDDFASNLNQKADVFAEKMQKELQKIRIHKISITGGKPEYVATGDVPGHLLNQFSLDEYKNYLRVATTTQPFFGWSEPVIFSTTEEDVLAESSESFSIPEPRTDLQDETKNNVYVLDDNLNMVGSVENLAPGERIYSARFIEDRLYLVTFFQVDPLFVIDLSKPSDPEVLGELKIPGYSAYLHPYDDNYVIGVGVDTTDKENRVIVEGIKLALFDVSDVSNPQQIAQTSIGQSGSSSEALYNHKAFLFDKNKQLLVIPVTVYENSGINFGKLTFQGSYVFSLSPESGFALKGRVTHLNETEQEALDKSILSDDYYFPPYTTVIQRSFYIDNTLYTISQGTLKAHNIDTLEEQASLQLPYSY